jgi:hypothetical protein
MKNKDSTRPMRHLITGVLFLVMSLLLFAPIARIVAVADEGETSSSMQASASGDQALILSKIQSYGIEKEYKAQMNTSQGVTVHVEFESGLGNTSGAYSTKEIEFQATFVKLVEFTDPSGNLRNTSTIVQTTDLTQLTYSPVTVTPVTYNGVQGYQLMTEGTKGNFSFKVVAYAFPNATSINATTLSPSALKVVIYVMNYPYNQTDSLLALQVETQSDRSIDTSQADLQGEVMSSDTNLSEQAFFSWNGPLAVDGASSAVKVSTSSQGDEAKTLDLIYPHGTSIVHDPTVGVFLNGAALVPFYLQPTFMLEAAAAFAIGAALSVTIVNHMIRR